MSHPMLVCVCVSMYVNHFEVHVVISLIIERYATFFISCSQQDSASAIC